MSKPNLPPLPQMDVGVSGQVKFAYSQEALTAYAEEAVRQAMAAHWQPMETAPTDGSLMLLFARLTGWNVHTGSKYAPSIHIGHFSDMGGGMWLGSAYRNQDIIDLDPISWARLPPPPETRDG